MKNFFTLLMFLGGTFVSHAQWQPDVRITNDAAASTTSLNNAWCVASSGDTVDLVWDDQRSGSTELYFKQSIDAGVSWSSDTRLTNNASESNDPCISILGSDIHIVWQDSRDGKYEIYYKHSSDGGVSWGPDTPLTNVAADMWNPSIALAGSMVNIVWEDERQGNSEIYYKSSTDGGLSWGTDIRLTNDGADSWNPSVAVSGSNIHVVWYDNRDGNWEIYYKNSTDGGISWGADTRLTNNIQVSRYPCIAVSGSIVHVVWHDARDGYYETYYKRSTDGGVSWGADTRLTNGGVGAFYPSIAVSGLNTHVVWFDQRDGNYEIYYKRSLDGGLNWDADIRLTNDLALSFSPSVAISGTAVHVVWQDMRDGNYEIYYKQDPTANPTGINDLLNSNSIIQIFPNPFSNSITVNIRNNDLSQIVIYDVTSREVLHNYFTNSLTLNTSMLEKGVYSFEVKNNKKILKTGKIIKD